MAKIYLGKDLDGESVYLTKHSWDCGWYWGFGYLGNSNCHYHMSSWLNKKEACYLKNHLSESPILDQEHWWQLGDLFKQAYALQEMAEIYHRGGANWTSTLNRGLGKDQEMCDRLNKDLERVLDNIWEFLIILKNSKKVA